MKYFWVACDTVGLWSKENFNSGSGIILSSVCHAKACEGENLWTFSISQRKKILISKERKDEKTQTQCWYEKWKQSDKVVLGMQRTDDSGMTPRLLIWDTEWVMLPIMKLTRWGKGQVLLDYCLACSGFWLTGWLVEVAGRKFSSFIKKLNLRKLWDTHVQIRQAVTCTHLESMDIVLGGGIYWRGRQSIKSGKWKVWVWMSSKYIVYMYEILNE